MGRPINRICIPGHVLRMSDDLKRILELHECNYFGAKTEDSAEAKYAA